MARRLLVLYLLVAFGPLIAFTAAFAASLTDAVYVAKILVTDAADVPLPAHWVVFVVETAPSG